MKEIGLVGFGNFSKFIVKYLKPFFDVCVYSNHDVSKEAEEFGIKVCSLEEASSKEIVILSKPVQFLEELLREMKNYVKQGSLILDVSSVKVKPVELMEKYLPETVDILGTHPMFGPKSGKNGIKGLKIVLCPIRMKNHQLEEIEKFLREKFELEVLIKTPEEHDREAAYVMGLTHLIGKAMSKLELPESDINTKSYQHLLDMMDMVKDDSEELFQTIEKENPFAEEARNKFIEKIEKVERRLEDI